MTGCLMYTTITVASQTSTARRPNETSQLDGTQRVFPDNLFARVCLGTLLRRVYGPNGGESDS